jgi:hypothetical protein
VSEAVITEKNRARRLDAVFFVLGGVLSIWLAYLTLLEGLKPGWPMLLELLFWVLVAYLALPRAHRILTRIYLPDYFIGRTRTGDGLLGDPVNLALMGTEEQLHQAFSEAGWTKADELTLASGWRIAMSSLRRRSYSQAPVSPLFLFGRRQGFAYQQEVAGSPSKRHHVRFWECPADWLLPGGFAVDWLAAGTFDRSVGLSLYTGQVTHKIDPNTDIERDHIVTTVTAANPRAALQVLADYSTGYHSRNGGGDRIETDGDLPILDLRGLAVDAEVRLDSSPEVSSVRVRRPGATVFGVVATALRALTSLGLAAIVLVGTWFSVYDGDASDLEAGLMVGVALIVAALFDGTLAVATFRGRNWSRLVLCALSLAGAALVLASPTLDEPADPVHLSLVTLAMSVLVLLALSSESAREFAAKRVQLAEPPAMAN